MQLVPETSSIVPTSVEDTTHEGKPARRLRLTSPHGALEIVYDPASKLVLAMMHEVTSGPTVRDGTVKRTTYAVTTVASDAPLPPERFAFDPGERRRVDVMTELMPAPESAGDPAGGVASNLVGRPAPPLLLATADGGAVDLEDLRGKVVVLDFWATWCAPCRQALPLLHEVAERVRRDDLPVEIVTVNVWEARDPASDTPDARLEAVRTFWRREGFTLPVAMDYTDETARAYGVRGIPATFVIRSDGVVHAQPHASVEALMTEIAAALAALEAPAPDDR
jgi:thiol-disulfide isomerase/thioredoxin